MYNVRTNGTREDFHGANLSEVAECLPAATERENVLTGWRTSQHANPYTTTTTIRSMHTGQVHIKLTGANLYIL
jgi:hypothetical protein